MIRKSVAPPLYCFTILLSLTLASWGVDPQFEAVHSYRTNGWQTASVAVGDVNADGKLDVVVANPCGVYCSLGGTVGVLLGIGDGTLQTVYSYSSGGQNAVSVALGDVNGDGHPDIVVANSNPNTVGVLLGHGHGKFQKANTYSSGGQYANFLALGDVNDDGKLDVLVADGCISSNDCSSGGVGVLLGNGDGTFQTVQLYDTGGYGPFSLAVADVNSDGRLDAVAANICRINDVGCREGVVSVLFGNGDGTFQTAQTYNSGGFSASSVAVADVNGDNKLDLLVTNRCIQSKTCFNSDGTASGVIGVLLGNGDGTFGNTERYRSGGYGAGAITVADVSHNGTLDIVVANICPIDCVNASVVIGVLSGNGDGTFQKAQRYDAGGHNSGPTTALAVADVNGDNKLDLVVATECVPEFICNHGGGVGILLARHSTTTILTSNLNPSIYGESVTLTATVISDGPIAPQGTVTFINGNKWLGKVTLDGGVAMLTTTKLPVGTLSITARYNGDIPSMKSTSETLVQVVH